MRPPENPPTHSLRWRPIVESLEELTAADVRTFIADHEIGHKTRRRYREVMHRLFAFARANDLLIATNPMSALPSYGHSIRRTRIVYLKDADVVRQYEVLAGHCSLLAAVHLMIEAGLRRAETLFLTVAESPKSPLE